MPNQQQQRTQAARAAYLSTLLSEYQRFLKAHREEHGEGDTLPAIPPEVYGAAEDARRAALEEFGGGVR